MKLFDTSVLKIEDASGSISLPQLMIPQFFELLFVQLLGTVNTIMLSHLSEEAVAAVGVANQMIGMLVVVLSIIKIGSAIFISIRFGAGHKRIAYNAAGQSLIWSAALGCVAGLLCVFFAGPLMAMMNLEGGALEYAAEYFRIRMGFIVLILLTNTFLSYLRCNGHSATTLAAGVTQNILNILLSYLVIYQPFPFFLSGVSGIAFAAVMSQCAGFVISLVSWKKHGFPLIFKPKLKILLRIITIGAPSATSNISYSISQLVTTAIIVSLGSTMVAAKVYFSNIFYFVYLFSLSIGQAGSIMVGRFVGHKDYKSADRLYRQNLLLAVCLNGLLALLIFLFGKQLLGLFTTNPEILGLAGSVMLVDIFVEIGRGMNHIGENALNGAGDVVPPMLVSMTTCWGISVLFSYIFGIRLQMGLVGCWIAFMMDELFRGCFYFWRWRSGKWKRIKL